MEKSLKSLWLAVSALLLILPVFLPSYAQPFNFFANVIGVTSVAMFVLSFPLSLFGLLLMALVKTILAVDSNAIGGIYLQMIIFFALGFVQWFWLAPKIWKKNSEAQSPLMQFATANSQLQTADLNNFQTADFDTEGQTPFERVIREKMDEAKQSSVNLR